MSDPGRHLDDPTLVGLLNDELTPHAARGARKHLDACWACRERYQRLERTALDFVAWRRGLVAPHLPLPEGPRLRALAAFREAAAQRDSRPGATARFYSLVIATLAIAATAVALFWVRERRAPIVSAAQVLQKAAESQDRALRAFVRPAVVQRVRIRTSTATADTTVYRDVTGGRSVHRNDRAIPEASMPSIRDAMSSAGMDWSDPLSISGYRAWRSGLSAKRETVSLGSRRLTVTTVALTGGQPSAEASLTVCAADYHTTARAYRSGPLSIEAAELAYEIRSLESLDAHLFPSSALPPPRELPTAAPPTETGLADSELQARVVLHGAGADVGEDLQIAEVESGSIEVRGFVDRSERRDELVAALQDILHVKVRVEVPSADVAPSTPPVAAALAATSADQASLPERVRERFPDSAAQREFSAAVLASARRTLETAGALRTLAVRYQPDRIHLLSGSGPQTLELMIRDDAYRLSQDLAALEHLLRPVLPSRDAAPAEQPGDWRSAALRLMALAASLHDSVVAALAASKATLAEAEAAFVRLDPILSRMQAALDFLSGQLRGPFLTREKQP
jgi:hypothetical protein